MRQPLVDLRGGVGVHAKEYVAEVSDRIDVVRLAGRDERVEAPYWSIDLYRGVLDTFPEFR